MNLRSLTESTETGSKDSGYSFGIISLKSRHYNKRDMLGKKVNNEGYGVIFSHNREFQTGANFHSGAFFKIMSVEFNQTHQQWRQ